MYELSSFTMYAFEIYIAGAYYDWASKMILGQFFCADKADFITSILQINPETKIKYK
jgi:hypothetical protein